MGVPRELCSPSGTMAYASRSVELTAKKSRSKMPVVAASPHAGCHGHEFHHYWRPYRGCHGPGNAAGAYRGAGAWPGDSPATIGQLIALVAAGLIAWWASPRTAVRTAAVLLAVAITIATWILPRPLQDALVGVRPSDGRLFAVGLAPAFVVGALALAWRA